MKPLMYLLTLTPMLLVLASPAAADEAGICGQWFGQIELVNDTGDAQVWATQFAPGDQLRGYFMKRGTPDTLQTTENTNPWHQHVNTLELFTNFNDWAMNVNVNGFTFEHDSKVPVNSAHNLRTLRKDTTRINRYGDRHDYLMWWTDWVSVSDEIEYFSRYSMFVKLEGSDAMLQTPNGQSAGAEDLTPDLLTHQIGPGNFVESYGLVSIFSHGGFDGSAQISGRITDVQTFPCAMVAFDPATGQYGLVGGEPEGEGGEPQGDGDGDGATNETE